jgi:hypothetical protein
MSVYIEPEPESGCMNNKAGGNTGLGLGVCVTVGVTVVVGVTVLVGV